MRGIKCMSDVMIRLIDQDTSDELVVPQTYGNLLKEDYTYILKSIMYTIEGEPSKTITLQASSNANITLNYQRLSEYVVDLNKFLIKNDGTSPVETSTGINDALLYAKQKGFNKVLMPYGQYCISENIPIKMIDNMTLDLNQATFKINPHSKQGSSIVTFDYCENSKLINGILLGDRYQHDYDSISGSHEWNCGVSLNQCENCELSNIEVRSTAGYGVYSSLGRNLSDLVIGITKYNLQKGGIFDDGVINNLEGTIRTMQPLYIDKAGDEFELGYNKGYMGYPYMSAKDYDSYFYDSDMNFISSVKEGKQYKKVRIPEGAVFAHFVFYQDDVPVRGDNDFGGTTIFVTNYKSPYKVKITNSIFEDNRCLGIAICGGRDFLIQDNTFKNNRGGAPGYAVDIEDGWEYVDDIVFKGNNFVNNANDLVMCAGDNITFDNNYFTSTVYIWGRTTNYKFINNKFENIKSNINYEYTTDTICSGNTYINCRIITSKKNTQGTLKFDNETLVNTVINTMSAGDELTNSSITSDSSTSVRLAGVYRNCTINCPGGDYISPKLYSCKIVETNLNCQGTVIFDECEFVDSSNFTTTNTKFIKVNNCKIKDSRFIINTWGAACILEITNCEISVLKSSKALLDFSAGRIISLVFSGNKVDCSTSNPVFNMYDTSYNLPNGSASISNNNFILSKYGYIFDGVNINSGFFNFSETNNSIVGAEMLSPKYLNNRYFIIK